MMAMKQIVELLQTWKAPYTANATNKQTTIQPQRYAETFWTTWDLEEALKGYYGEDFKATDEELTDIMERIDDQLLDDITEHGNDRMLSMAIRIIDDGLITLISNKDNAEMTGGSPSAPATGSTKVER